MESIRIREHSHVLAFVKRSKFYEMKSYSQQDDVGEPGIRWEGIGDHADRSERVVNDEVDAV
jgi:hypothetical protein